MKINKHLVEKVYCVSRDEYEYEHDDTDCLFFVSIDDAVQFIQLNRDFSHRPDISNNMENILRIIEEAYRLYKSGSKEDKLYFVEKYMNQKVFYFTYVTKTKEKINLRAGHITDINFTRNKEDHAFPYCVEVCNYSGTGGLMAFSIEQIDENKDYEEELKDMVYKLKGKTRRNIKTETKAKSIKRNTRPVSSGDKVYFIQESNSRAIKIGKAVDPIARLKQLQTGQPYELKILKVIEGGYEEERNTHKMFEQYKLSGEWFQCSDELMDYIDGLKSVNY